MYSAIVVDDQESARETIVILIKKYKIPIDIIGKAASVDEAVDLINQLSPQIVFLDINMPIKNGLELFNYVNPEKLQIIFTTGHHEYAIKAINLSACYYLLKPISPIEFKKATDKAIDNINKGYGLGNNINLLKELMASPNIYPEKIIISSNKGYELIAVKDILYFEGDKNYTWIHVKDKKYLAAKTIKEYEETMNPKEFYRIHQSFIVHKIFVKSILNTKPDVVELTNEVKLAVSRDRKKNFIEWLIS